MTRRQDADPYRPLSKRERTIENLLVRLACGVGGALVVAVSVPLLPWGSGLWALAAGACIGFTAGFAGGDAITRGRSDIGA